VTRRAGAAFVVLLSLSSAWGADPPPPPSAATAMENELAAIREQLVALDIEMALYALNAILERSDLPESTRVDALDLRAQAHVASDNLDAAEMDYRALLALRPAYAPDRELTSKKAMDRFVKIKASTIGALRVDVEPKDATLAVDGRTVPIPAGGVLAAVAGTRKLNFARKGFDPHDVDVTVAAGQETPITIRLVPNARSLVVRTDVDGVDVALDGLASGVTARAADAVPDANAPATLLIQDVAIGEHEVRLSKPCFASESLQEMVSVDLADRSPKLMRVVAMRPSRTRVTATGATYEGELHVDGERTASLPLTSFAMCPGLRVLEVIASGRVVWSGSMVGEESDVTLDLTPRPNAVLVGAAWPKSWEAGSASWSLRGRIEPPAGVDLAKREGWERISLPPGTDLAVAVIPGAGIAGDDRIVLYGPALQEVEEPALPPGPSPPQWRRATLGAVPVDAGAGSVVLASIAPSGPAARAGLLPGDRLVAIAGRKVAGAASAVEAIAASDILATLALDVASPGGDVRKVECQTAAEPRLAAAKDEAGRVVRAAWASVDAAAGGPDAAAALASFALLLERAGRESAAQDVWRRVRAMGDGALATRADYALGAGLAAKGKREEAIAAFNQARSEASTIADPVLAAAAVDRLADLGVAPR
jgi:hypothetical protein